MPEIETGAAPAAAAEAPVAPAATSPEATKPATIEDTMAAVFDKLNPPRAPDGKFTSNTPAEPAEAPTDAAPEAGTETTGEAAPTEPASPAIPRPQSYAADLDEWWASLPPDRQEFLSKRESEAHKRISELGQQAKDAEQFRQLVEPIRQVATRYNADPQQTLNKLIAANEYLERDPQSAIKWLADAYGINLAQLVWTPQEGQPENDHVRSLQTEINRLKQVVLDTRNQVQTREQREIEAQQASLAKMVEDFAQGKEYWSEIEADVLDEIRAIKGREPNLEPRKVLEKAHERALKINDTVSAKLKEADRRAEEAKKAAEAKKKADEAKRLASMNVKSSNGTSPKAKGSWEDTMRSVADRLLG